MRISEALVMLSVGAVAAAGTMWYVTLPDPAPATTTSDVFSPVEATPEPNETAQVTRAAATAIPLGAADRIHAIIAQAEDAIDSVAPLTPEQQEVVAFFEEVARNRNAEGAANPDAEVSFDNLTIDRLTVRYYYSTAARYAQLDPGALLAEQSALVQDNICNQPAIRQLISDYGLEYNYRFISRDFRFIGEVSGDLSKCAG